MFSFYLSVCFVCSGYNYWSVSHKTWNFLNGCTMTISRSSLSIKVIKCKKVKVMKSPKTLEKQLKLSVKSHGQVWKGNQVQKGQIMSQLYFRSWLLGYNSMWDTFYFEASIRPLTERHSCLFYIFYEWNKCWIQQWT